MLRAVVSAQLCSVHCTLNDTPETGFSYIILYKTHTHKQTVVTLPGIVILPPLLKPISPQKLEYCVKYKIVKFLKDFI